MTFAKAFVDVQSYMNKAGSKASYKETRKIVHNQGLSVNDYTRIATLMNENPDFRNDIQKMIKEGLLLLAFPKSLVLVIGKLGQCCKRSVLV